MSMCFVVGLYRTNGHLECKHEAALLYRLYSYVSQQSRNAVLLHQTQYQQMYELH